MARPNRGFAGANGARGNPSRLNQIAFRAERKALTRRRYAPPEPAARSVISHMLPIPPTRSEPASLSMRPSPTKPPASCDGHQFESPQLPRSAPEFARQSLPAKFGFPIWTMEAAGPKQRPPQYSVRKLLKRRGTNFGSNLNRLSQPHGAPLLGPEHRQTSQALDAEPAREATLHRGFRQGGGDERERHRHPNRALALVFAHGASI
jgi:hypothetical protein